MPHTAMVRDVENLPGIHIRDRIITKIYTIFPTDIIPSLYKISFSVILRTDRQTQTNTQSLPRWRCWQRRSTRCVATVIGESGFEAQAGRIIVSGYSGVRFEIKFSGRHRRAGTTVSSLICDRWLILGLETLSISRCLNH